MGKLARDKRSVRNGQRWKEQTKIVNNVTHALMPVSQCYVTGMLNVGKTYQTLAEVTSTHALQERPTCSIPGKNSVSAPSLLLESSASFTVPVVARPRPLPSPAAVRGHPCCCRWARRTDRGKGPPVYDKICHCKRDRQQHREKLLKQQLCGPSKSCLKRTCQKQERSVPSMPPAKHTDASVQLLYYKDKLTATEELVEKKDEIIRLQNESLALAEKRLATLTAARMELRRTHAPGATYAPGPVHTPAPTPASTPAPATAPADCPAPTHSPSQQKQTTYRARIQDFPMQIQYKPRQESLVQTLQENLSVMEELYIESFYEAAKQEDIIESLRLSCYELRDMEVSKANEVGRLQHVLKKQQWTVEQCQTMAAEVERLKSEIYNFVNSSNNDSGVWEGEETSPPEIREDLQDITSQLLKLKDILTETSSSADDENMKLKEQNTHLQKQILRLQSHIAQLQTALTSQDQEYACQYDTTHNSPVRGGVQSRCRQRTNSQCQPMKKQTTSSVHGGRSQTMTAVRVGIDDTHVQDQDAEQSPRSTSSQARCATCATNKRGAGMEPLTLLQMQLTAAQQRSAALCQEARRALTRVRKWALRMRIRLREREQEIERQKQEIEELRKYINKLKDSSEGKALSDKYDMKKRILDDEEEHCKALRKEMEKLKYPSDELDDDEYNIDDICDEREVEPKPCRNICKPMCQLPPEDEELDKETSHKCRPRPQCRIEKPKEYHKSEQKNIEAESSCYEINPGEIAEVDSPGGMKVLVKCRDCERKTAESTNREIQTERGPRVTTYEQDECSNCEPCPKPKKQDDKQCNEELCLMPTKNKEAKKPPQKSPRACVPCYRHPRSSSSKDTLICHSNESLRSLKFKGTVRYPKNQNPSLERQVSFISRPEDPVEVPISFKCRPLRTCAKPEPCEQAYKLKLKTKKKDKKKLPTLDIKSSKKMFKESKQRKDRKGEQKRCCCSGVCRCRSSTQAWKMEACSSPCSRCSLCSGCSRASHDTGSSLSSQEEPRANSVDSYHSLLMGHLKKKFPFLVQRWGSCEASVQQPLRADACTSRSRPFEELVGAERKSLRPQPAPSKTLAAINKVPQPRCLPLVNQHLPRSEDSSS